MPLRVFYDFVQFTYDLFFLRRIFKPQNAVTCFYIILFYSIFSAKYLGNTRYLATDKNYNVVVRIMHLSRVKSGLFKVTTGKLSVRHFTI